MMTLVLGILGLTASAADLCYDYREINVDIDLPTSWWGINEVGTVTGNFCPVANCDVFDVEGAILDLSDDDGNVITKVPNPLGAPGFVADFDVNRFGTSAGYTFSFTTGQGEAFTRTADGQVTILPTFLPDTAQQIGTGINNRGHVVGYSLLNDGSVVSWRYRPGHGFARIDLPSGDQFLVFDINNFGTVAGVATDADGVDRGVLRTRWGQIRSFASPTGVLSVGGLNDFGQIVGAVFDPDASASTPFVWSRWRGLRTANVPAQSALGDASFEG
ncbi:MAG: hypothetical protein AAF602_31900, partial [Myxococcota bacterium]